MNDKQQGQFYIGFEHTKGKKGAEITEIEWTKSGEPFQAAEGHWIGAQVGLFCTRDNRVFNDAGYLDIDWFETTID